jgi:hypothetical protein
MSLELDLRLFPLIVKTARSELASPRKLAGQFPHFIISRDYTRKNAQVDAILMKTGLNNVLLPTLFIAVNNIEQHCYTRFRLNNIVEYC